VMDFRFPDEGTKSNPYPGAIDSLVAPGSSPCDCLLMDDI